MICKKKEINIINNLQKRFIEKCDTQHIKGQVAHGRTRILQKKNKSNTIVFYCSYFGKVSTIKNQTGNI